MKGDDRFAPLIVSSVPEQMFLFRQNSNGMARQRLLLVHPDLRKFNYYLLFPAIEYVRREEPCDGRLVEKQRHLRYLKTDSEDLSI